MRIYIQRIIIGITVVIYSFGVIGGASVALAATTSAASNIANNGQALEIAPPVIYLTVNPGQTINTQILIRDISSGNLLVTGQVNDFIAAGTNGSPKILLNGDDNNNPYTLKNWVATLPTLTLIPQQIKSLPVTFNVPTNAAPGGHYGVIRFTATPPSLPGSGVSLSASLGALVLMTVTGNIKQVLSVQSFSVNQNGKTRTLFQSAPLNFVEEFKNTGNVHLQPVGQVTINDMFGRKLAAVNVNLPPGNILPSSSRQFSEPLDSTVIGNKTLFGKYTANLSVTYGTPKQTLTSSVTFWVIPYRLIAILIVALVVIFFALRFIIRRYNRYILGQAKNKSPRSRRR